MASYDFIVYMFHWLYLRGQSHSIFSHVNTTWYLQRIQKITIWWSRVKHCHKQYSLVPLINIWIMFSTCSYKLLPYTHALISINTYIHTCVFSFKGNKLTLKWDYFVCHNLDHIFMKNFQDLMFGKILAKSFSIATFTKNIRLLMKKCSAHKTLIQQLKFNAYDANPQTPLLQDLHFLVFIMLTWYIYILKTNIEWQLYTYASENIGFSHFSKI